LSALTKMFIVLQLLFSLVCAVLLVLFVSKTENYKAAVESERTKNVGLAASIANESREKSLAQADVSRWQKQYNDTLNELVKVRADAASAAARLEAEKQALATQLAAANAQIQTLTAINSTDAATISANNTELATLRKQVPELTKQYNEIYRAKNEVDNQLKAAELAIRKLQQMLAQAPGAGAGAVAPIGSEGQIQVLTATSATTAKINGKVSDVALAQGRTLIEMPLGERDGIKVGTRMYVYRASGYVGDATVERVSPDQSVAVVVSTKPGETVKIGDLVSTLGQ
jgi:hypothetical protein